MGSVEGGEKLMIVMGLDIVKACTRKHADADKPLRNLVSMLKKSSYRKLLDIQQDFNSADSVGPNKAVFNIKFNRYRAVVAFDFTNQMCIFLFAGTHKDYDKLDIENL